MEIVVLNSIKALHENFGESQRVVCLSRTASQTSSLDYSETEKQTFSKMLNTIMEATSRLFSLFNYDVCDLQMQIGSTYGFISQAVLDSMEAKVSPLLT